MPPEVEFTASTVVTFICNRLALVPIPFDAAKIKSFAVILDFVFASVIAPADVRLTLFPVLPPVSMVSESS